LADEPIAAYRDLVAHLVKKAEQNPADFVLREQLAHERVSLGLVLAGMNRQPDAETAFRAALADYGWLASHKPLVARHLAGAATARVHLVRTLRALRRGADAEREQRAAVAEFDQLIANNPRDYRTNIASVMLTLMPEASTEPSVEPEPGMGT